MYLRDLLLLAPAFLFFSLRSGRAMAAIEEPKKSMSAYFLYIQANRDAVQKELGVKDFGPVTKNLSARWKALSASERTTFDKQAADAKAQYDKDLGAFQAAGGVKGAKRKEAKEAKDAKAAKKAKKSADTASGKPKKPAGGAYGVYMSHHREEIMKGLPAGSKITAITKTGGERWKALSAQDKEKYEKEYQIKKAKYEEELKAWKETNGGAADDDDEDANDDGAVGGA